jgi:hypothetical protein
MVTQPAYISNLKSYARAKLSNNDDVEDSIADFSNESDRGAILLAATGIEDMLEYEILNRFPGLENDEPARKRMFEQDGQIASFSKKIEMAYALGIIDRDYRKKIDVIREIRNACAHSRKPLSLQQSVLRAACEAVISDMLPGLANREPNTIRIAFIAKCGFINHYIATGEKLESAPAILKYLEMLRGELGET